VKIPKRVNTAWDWVEKHFTALAFIAVLLVAAGTALVLPTLAALVLGGFAGAVAVHRRMSRRVRRLRAELDDLLRENGALRHQKAVLASGVIAAAAQPTAALLMIPAELDEHAEPSAEDTKRLEILPDDFLN
jgi:hypothetical protein